MRADACGSQWSMLTVQLLTKHDMSSPLGIDASQFGREIQQSRVAHPINPHKGVASVKCHTVAMTDTIWVRSFAYPLTGTLDIAGISSNRSCLSP
jgi:hypothetical protein